ncbi:MAG: sigma-70 family RNA polymerase sigma factor [Micromonosporaceae bacterium]|nr:sigma-70 family RNA polymerase sigma factor [Micromonosporaceae bacterium]
MAGRATRATVGEDTAWTAPASTDEASHVASERRARLSAGSTRTNRRGERAARRNDEDALRRRADTDTAEGVRTNQRHRDGRPRNPMPWSTGPTRPLQAATLSAIPSAREETVELAPLPSPPPGAGSLNGQAPRAVPTQPDYGVVDRDTSTAEREQDEPAARPARPAAGDAAAEVWALVERAQAGDADAFAQIYHRYLDVVFRFIYFRVTNRQVAEDLTAETFLRALKRIGGVTWQGRDIGAWLITIARNLVADHFKSGRYRFEVPTGDVLEADDEDHGPEGSPELAVVDHITNVTLLGAVQRLNPEQRECIVLRFLHGFSVAETAQAMGKNEGAIKALQYRAVRALHRLLPEGFRP